jgi:hypothetical protein
LNVHRIKRINLHLADGDENRSLESISDSKNCLNRNGDLDNPNVSEDDWEADKVSDMELDNGREDSKTPAQRNGSTTPNVPRLIWPIRRTKKRVEKAFMTVNIMETRKNMVSKKK